VGVRVGFDALDPRILPDMGVKVAFQDTGAAADLRAAAGTDRLAASGVLVPAGAIRQAQGRDYVFVVSGGVAERRAVAAAGEHNGSVLVQSGLAPGENVVIEGPTNLVDGAAVSEKSE
jgi:hypothetical protein